jgi:dephospho-CoA kinase
MLKVGLTGGIACGKSAVADMFAARGAYVVKADEIAHRLMRPGERVYAAVVEKFGRDILDEDGRINRQKLAAVAFSASPPRIEELNRLVHPAVVAEQDRWSEQIGRKDPAAVAIVEAALIFEADLRGHFDRIVVVVCNPEQKVQRLASRLGVDLAAARAEVERRSRAQWPDAEKERLADMVIRNAGSLEETGQQVDRVFAKLKRQVGLTVGNQP